MTAMSKRRLRYAAAGFVLFMSVLGLAGWVGANTWLPAHVLNKTGRTEVPAGLCARCHARRSPPPAPVDNTGLRYVSPEGLAVSPDGARLFVAASGIDRLLEVDLSTGKTIRSVEVPDRPYGVAVSADGRRLAVSSRDGDRVRILDAATLEVRDQIEVTEPLGLALSADGGRVFVAEGLGNAVVLAEPGSPSSTDRLVAGMQPYALALSRDGHLLAVANRLASPVTPGVLGASEVTLVDPRRNRILERRELRSAHLSEGIAVSSDGSFALASAVRFRNLLPLTQVARGAVMNSAVVFIETRAGGRTVQFPLDEVNAFFADPSGVALTPDDRVAFVAHMGARMVTAIDVRALREVLSSREGPALDAVADDLGISAEYVLARIPTRQTPRALALSPSGDRLYVAERLADSIAVIDTTRFAVVERIDLGGPGRLTPERRGERLFHDASVTFQAQFSCRSCHPDGHSDGLIWDFEIDGVGRNLVDTRSLRGIRDTAPFKWNGKNPDLATQCGPRFARVLTRSDPFPPDKLKDLVAFIESIPVPPKRPSHASAEALESGRQIFFRARTNDGEMIPRAQRCNTCHRPPLFTDRLVSDVGTGGRFDTPHLFDIGSTAPYLHDGRAMTLEEIWTVHSPEDSHGIAEDLSKVQLNDLVIYLRSL